MTISIPLGWNNISICITCLSFLIAIYQVINSSRIKKANEKLEKANEKLENANIELKIVNEQKYASRCRELVGVVEDLSIGVVTACSVVNNSCLNKKIPCNILTAKIDSIVVLSKQLIRFCVRMDDEHVIEFGHHVDGIDLSKLVNLEPCLQVDNVKSDYFHVS